MYGREVDGKELSFGVSGMLLKNALVMYDRETESLWKHFTGEAIEGPLAGRKLEMLSASPSVPWNQWVREQPNTLVLKVDGRTHVDQSQYESYFADESRLGIRPVQNLDNRLPAKSLVIGVLAGKQALAVPVVALEQKRLVRFRSGQKSVIAYFEPGTRIFGAAEEYLGDPIERLEGRFAVSASGARISIATGEGHPQLLRPLNAIRSFWFAWADHYPKTELVR